ncbi:MAG: hypothetical protein WCH20_05175 [Nitrospira sp.]|jgi:hypothetical protein
MASVFTNFSVYLATAEEALAESTRQLNTHRTPKPDGQPGYILASDPERRSFKQSLIAIAFAGMYLEALLSLIGRARWGEAFYDEKIDRFKYEEKLKLLGIVDQNNLAGCTRFREARNDLMHEKALSFEMPGSEKKVHTKNRKRGIPKKDIRVAQEEAAFGVKFVKSIGSMLGQRPNPTIDRTAPGENRVVT